MNDHDLTQDQDHDQDRDAVAVAFERFATPAGYTRACRVLAFDRNRWTEFEEYANALGAAVTDAGARTPGRRPVGVDLACGEYAWLARHYSSEFSRLYLLDQSESAMVGTEALREENTQFVLGDAAITLMSLPEVDFVYGGFSFYRSFVPGVTACLASTGSFFVMVPVDGDDLRWREMVSGRTVAARGLELKAIEADLRREFTVTTQHQSYHWVFAEAEIATVVAAIAAVCFGWDRLTPQRGKDLEVIRASLAERVANGRFTLTQDVVLWHGHRDGHRDGQRQDHRHGQGSPA